MVHRTKQGAGSIALGVHRVRQGVESTGSTMKSGSRGHSALLTKKAFGLVLPAGFFSPTPVADGGTHPGAGSLWTNTGYTGTGLPGGLWVGSVVSRGPCVLGDPCESLPTCVSQVSTEAHSHGGCSERKPST